MARQRDHKAEYQRRKEIARQSGFPSVRSYKRTRKSIAIPRRQSFSIASIRRAGVVWSADHSRVSNSQFKMDFSDQDAIDYYNAYVASMGDKNAKMNRLHKYLVGNGLVTEEEWIANYLLAQP
jgi:hypothetical protein